MTTHTRSIAAPDLASVADWFKSTYSGNDNNCVEAADLIGTPYNGVAVRDSKDLNGAALLFEVNAFAACVDSLKKNAPAD